MSTWEERKAERYADRLIATYRERGLEALPDYFSLPERVRRVVDEGEAGVRVPGRAPGGP